MNRSLCFSAAACFLLGGCMVARQPAPVVERTPEAKQSKPLPGAGAASARSPADTYTVKPGDTLYSIARSQGLDYRDLARWNNLSNPGAIEVGQALRLKDPQAIAYAAPTAPTSPSAGEAVTAPYQAPPPVEGRPMGADSAPPRVTEQKREAAEPAAGSGVITAPQGIKVPYSQAALAKLQGAPAETSPAATPPAAAAPERTEAAPSNDPDALAWGWPTKGTVIAGFNENGGPKGVQIAGSLGQPIVASAPGRVVYTGSGLRGYGNLVIIKHNDTYLSAYAHNRSVLVKQGENVAKGQKIAEMGDSDASRVMLHFEIRRMGKPVDPIKFLPPT
jgi:lipoprotein NlpD